MKICLTGSTRFMDRYHEANRRLTLAGHIVYTVAMVSTSERGNGGPKDISPADKEWLDLVHLKKIMESDMIIVIGVRRKNAHLPSATLSDDSYVGESTRREIRWAAMLNKEILMESGIDAICRGKQSPRYDMKIPGHDDKEWEHNCARDGHSGSNLTNANLEDVLSGLFGMAPKAPENDDPESRPA